jgi:hypothetical protein
MRGMEALSLTDLPIVNMKGDLVCLTENKYILFPQVVRSRSIVDRVFYSNYVNGVLLNDKVFMVLYSAGLYKVIYRNTVSTFLKIHGVVIFGETIFVFVDDNKCFVINTLTDETKLVQILAPSNIVHVYQLTTYLFAVVSSPPTTVYIYSMDDAGNIATATSSVSLPSYSYGVFANPKVNPKLLKKGDIVFLYGEDATVLLSLQVSDLVYLRTEDTVLQKTFLFPELEEQGIEFVSETVNFYLFKNSLFNNYIWLNKGDNKIFFSTNYIYLSSQHVVYDNNLYYIQDTITSTKPNILLDKELTVKFKAKNLDRIFIEVLETTDSNIGNLGVLSRYLDGQNFFNYFVKDYQTVYRLGLRGEEFVVSLYTNQACRIRSFQAWLG